MSTAPAPLRFYGVYPPYFIEQENNMSIIAYNYNTYSTATTISSELMMPLLSIFSYNRSSYFQYSDRIVQVITNTTLNKIISVSTLTLPTNSPSLKLVFVANIPFGFTVGNPSIVLFKICLGQKSGSQCLPYNCSDPNCLDCSFNASVCVTCSMFYSRNMSNYCIKNKCVDSFCINCDHFGVCL